MAKTDKNTTSAGGGLKAKLMGMTDTNRSEERRVGKEC